MRPPSARVRVCGALLAAALLLLGPSPWAAQPGTLGHLDGVDEMKRWFNANQGRPRLIVLLSPT
jgi:hypothetical protein